MNASLKKLSRKVRKLEKDLQNLKSKAKGDKQLCKDLQEKVYRIDEGKTWRVGSSHVSQLYYCSFVPDNLVETYIIGKRAWRPVRFQGAFSNYIRETAASAFWKTKGERTRTSAINCGTKGDSYRFYYIWLCYVDSFLLLFILSEQSAWEEVEGTRTPAISMSNLWV